MTAPGFRAPGRGRAWPRRARVRRGQRVLVHGGAGGAGHVAVQLALARACTGHVVSAPGWGTHSLAPLSFRGATYSGIFTLLPMLTGRGRAHHGEILRGAAVLADAGALRPLVGARRFTRRAG